MKKLALFFLLTLLTTISITAQQWETLRGTSNSDYSFGVGPNNKTFAISRTGIRPGGFNIVVQEYDDFSLSWKSNRTFPGGYLSASYDLGINNGILYLNVKGSDELSFSEFLYKYDGTNWELIDFIDVNYNDISNYVDETFEFDSLGLPYKLFENQVISKYNGTSWEDVSELDKTLALSEDSNGINYRIYPNESGNPIVQKQSGSGWLQLGTIEFSSSSNFSKKAIMIDSSNKPYVVLSEGINSNQIRVFSFNGSIWEEVGDNSALGQGERIDIAIDRADKPYIVFVNELDEKLKILRFNGFSWNSIGEDFSITSNVNSFDLSHNNENLIYAFSLDEECSQDYTSPGFTSKRLRMPFIDDEILTIECADSLVVINNTDTCMASITLELPSVNTSEIITFLSERSDGLDLDDPFSIGDTTISWTALSENGTTSNTCDQVITVFDGQSPVAICKDFTVQLDDNGAAILSTSDIDNGSFDNCEIDLISLDKTSFDITDIGINQITLTVTDLAGNSSTCVSNVNVTPWTDSCDGSSNYALDKPSIQSSTYGNGIASLANDGNISGSSPWTADLQHTDEEFQPWWEVDLEENILIEKVTIHNRSDKLQNRLSNFYVLLSKEPFGDLNLQQILNDQTKSSQFFNGPASLIEEFSFTGDFRYLRIQLLNEGIIHMAELEVYGCPAESSICDAVVPPVINQVGPFLDIDESIQLIANPVGGSWSGPVDSNGVFAPIELGAGSYEITYSFTNEENCTKTDTITIIVNPSTESCIDNIALNKISSQSSTYGNGSANLANDGNLEGSSPWSADLQHTISGESESWWQVDLGENFKLNKIKIYNRTDKLQARLNNFYVLISSEPFTSSNLTDNLANSNIASTFFEGSAGLIEELSLNSNGRYVRIQLSGEGTIHMAEVQLYGCPVNNSNTATSKVNQNNLKLSPNPTSNQTAITFDSITNLVSLKVFDISGRVVKEFDTKTIRDQKSFQLSVNTLPAGSYIIQTQDDEGISYQKQLVIKR